jgi:hypothetical protein
MSRYSDASIANRQSSIVDHKRPDASITNHPSQIANGPMTRSPDDPMTPFFLKLTACQVTCRLALRMEVYGGTN